MLPKTATGWILLIVVLAVLIWGAAGAGQHLGNAAHEAVTGVRNFFARLRG